MSIWGYEPSQCVSLVSRHVICTIHEYFSADEIGPQIKQHPPFSSLPPRRCVCVSPIFFFFSSPPYVCACVSVYMCSYLFIREYKYLPPPLLKQRVMNVFEKSTLAGSEWKHFKETLHLILTWKKKKENKDSAPVHKESITAGWPGGDRDHSTKPEITSLCRQAVPH